VTAERLIGFQTRLESRINTTSQMIFCTIGVFLHTLLAGDGFLGGLTHLIIDEVHCRDRYTDMLLGIIRTRLCKFPGLRLILLSDSVFCNVLSTYFFKCSIVKTSISVKPNMELFLEEILTCTKFLAKQDDPSCIHGRTDIVCLISHGADPTMKVRRALASDTACYI